jgi:HAD superfamily hydrolase (TIGR01509 family)
LPKGNTGIRGVIFDLDGTLVDSYRAHIEAWIRTAREFGVEAAEGDVKPHMGRSSEDICRALLGDRCPEDIEDGYRFKDRTYCDIIPEVVTAVDGALETVSELRRRRYLMAIASSNPVEVITRSLAAVGLEPYANCIASQDEVMDGKPAPDLFILAGRKLGLPPEQCIAVGDTCYDVLGGKAAGMLTAAFTGGCQTAEMLSEARPDYLLLDLRELLGILPPL